MTELALAATAIGTVVSTAGALYAGDQQAKAYKYEAQIAEQRANEARAAAGRQMEQTRRKTELTQSRLRAVASTATGKATDTGTLNLGSDIAQRGEYSAMMDWAQGENRARGFEDQAAAARFKGKAARTGSYLKAGGTLFDGIGTFGRIAGGTGFPRLNLGGGGWGGDFQTNPQDDWMD